MLKATLPSAQVMKQKILFVLPKWEQFQQTTEVFDNYGIHISWLPAQITESHVSEIDNTESTEISEGNVINEVAKTEIEKLLTDQLKAFTSRSTKVLDTSHILSNLTEVYDGSFDRLFDISPFYFTGVETFKGIHIKKWPVRAQYYRIIIFEDFNSLKGNTIPEDKVIYHSGIINIKEKITNWPEFEINKDYGYLIDFYDSTTIDNLQISFENWKGKFWIIDKNSLKLKEAIALTLNSSEYSIEEKNVIQACMFTKIGNFEKALKLLLQLFEKYPNNQMEYYSLISSMCKRIISSLQELKWREEAEKVQKILTYLEKQFITTTVQTIKSINKDIDIQKLINQGVLNNIRFEPINKFSVIGVNSYIEENFTAELFLKPPAGISGGELFEEAKKQNLYLKLDTVALENIERALSDKKHWIHTLPINVFSINISSSIIRNNKAFKNILRKFQDYSDKVIFELPEDMDYYEEDLDNLYNILTSEEGVRYEYSLDDTYGRNARPNRPFALVLKHIKWVKVDWKFFRKCVKSELLKETFIDILKSYQDYHVVIEGIGSVDHRKWLAKVVNENELTCDLYIQGENVEFVKS